MTTDSGGPVVLHVAPHPDDEVLGAGGTLISLRHHGWRVHSLVCTLGRPEDHGRRRSELDEAAGRAGFVTTVMEPLAALSSGDDLVHGAAAVSDAVDRAIRETGATLVVSPHPHDGHHGHEAVGRGVRDALHAHPAVRWWMWGLWSDLPLPTLMVPISRGVMAEVASAIEAYEGENQRNAYHILYPARATAAAVLGSERVLGFGAAASCPEPTAELLTEAHCQGDTWRAGSARILDFADPLAPLPNQGLELTSWLHSPSPRQTIGRR